MKKVYLSFMVLFLFASTLFAQDARVWDFEAWEAVPAGPIATNEIWRGGGSGSTVALATEFPIGTANFNFSTKVLQLDIPTDNGGVVFEGINPAFDRSVHNAISFLVYAPSKAEWAFEMMNSKSENKWSKTIKTEDSTANDWFLLIYEIPPTVASDLTKFVLKPRNASAWGKFYIDDVTFFKYVKPAPVAITISNESNITVGKKSPLKLTFTPTEEGGLVDQDASFVSSNPSVLEVNEVTGVLTAVSAGEATIKVTSKADGNISASQKFTVSDINAANTFTAYNFETSTYVPTHSAYTFQIVDNPSKTGINTSSKVLSITSGQAWQWTNWEPGIINPNKVSTLKFKIFSETEIATFNVDFGCNGAGSTTVASLKANEWTEISVNLTNQIDWLTTFYIFTKDKWNSGTFFIDDIMFVAGDGVGYVPVSNIGTLTEGSITKFQEKLMLTAPTVSPANATNKNFNWMITSSEPANAATIDPASGEITPLKNGTITVKAISVDNLFEAVATVTISGQNVGSEKMEVSKTKLYPNPAKNTVYFSGDTQIERVSIFSLTGQNILSGNVKDNQFDISSLSRGVYLVNMISKENTSSVTRLIVE